MTGLKLTSPGTLLILAVVLAGGIFLLDSFCLRPYVEHQRDAALQDQAIRTERVVRLAIQSEQQMLSRACSAWAREAALTVPESHSTGDSPLLGYPKNTFAAIGAEFALVRDTSGKTIASWFAEPISERGHLPTGESAGGKTDAHLIIEAVTSSADAFTGGGVLRIGNELAVIAHSDLTRSDGKEPERELLLGRFVDEEIIEKISGSIGGGLIFVASKVLPEESGSSSPTARVFWSAGPGQLVVAWLVFDPRGKPLGYFQADIQEVYITRQASLARRIVLIILSLSLGLALLVIVGTHILIAGPVMRLLKRLQNIDNGEPGHHELTSDLHGEPLVLARRLESAFDKLATISKTDQLTQLANRRHFEEVMGCFYRQARRYSRPLSLMVMDVDFFKAVNDAGGHQAGDELLKIVARCIERASRKADLPARIGGDEFAILLPETTAFDAQGVAERIRESVSTESVVGRSVELNVTISIGLTDLNAAQIASADAMISLAVQSLYVAKRQGRNRVVLAHDLGEVEGGTRTEETGKVSLLQKKLAGLDTRFKDLFLRAVEEIMEILEQRDPHMADHARKVQYYALLIAREMELPHRLLKRIQVAAMLHDIGMVAMPDSVILNPGPLDNGELETMQRHALLSVRIMERMEFLEQEIPAVRYHHERFDGKGYPEGLKGAAIPLTARILAVADSFDAMTSPRTFRPAKTQTEALAELRKSSGLQFDPTIVDTFICAALRLGERLTACPDKGVDLADEALPSEHTASEIPVEG